ncbi:MAG TPA: UDP-N-acetylmuramoyl-L-alanine--D-glutamate ligase [Dehalococcoidia bacterium]|nr:UDP-N-acetylmuramoyl-L-alanine--D-glutamate ligase [Dehalococcoidia bacterium]
MTVVGLGIEGIDLVRYLSTEGAQVTVSDSRSEDALRAALDAIADSVSEHDVTLSLGANRTSDFVDAEVVFVSQGVPAELPALQAAHERGVPISSMTRLFFEHCPAPIAGITGSSGKTTTTALVASMLDAAGIDHVAGGNIGVGLLGLLDEIEPTTKVVVELSHTQLESLDESPHVACVTNVTPNHLDQYPWADYVALKRRIFEYQRADDLAIFNLDDEVCAEFIAESPGRVETTSMSQSLPGDGVALEGDAIVRRGDGASTEVLTRSEIALRGDHNVANVLSALAVAHQLGVPDDAAATAVRSFTGVAHRLEPVATVRGVQYVNDSIATTPERTLAGIRSYEEPLVLILGGRDKDLPLSGFAVEAASRCRAVITFGEAGEQYAAVVRSATTGESPSVDVVADVASATRLAAERAVEGDVVLFAPAGTSFDAYPNFERRGEDFREAVRQLEAGA